MMKEQLDRRLITSPSKNWWVSFNEQLSADLAKFLRQQLWREEYPQPSLHIRDQIAEYK